MTNAAIERLHPQLASHLAYSGIHEAYTPPTAEAWRTFLTRLNETYRLMDETHQLAPSPEVSASQEVQAAEHDIPSTVTLNSPQRGWTLDPAEAIQIPVRFA